MRNESKDNSWFEETWRYRETVLYPKYLGGRTNGLITAIPSIAFEQIGARQIDPRWLHCGVLTFPPVASRTGFSFVTSGLSNAWDVAEPDGSAVSGLGIELRIDNKSDEYWAKEVLLRLSAMQLLIAAEGLAGVRPLARGDRIRIGNDTFGGRSEMTTLIAADSAHLQNPSGTFDLIQLFAVTDAEREFASMHGADALVKVLREKTSYPVNDIARLGVV